MAATFQDFEVGEAFEDAGAAAMVSDRFGEIEGLPAAELEAPGKIDVLFVHEEVFVKVFLIEFDVFEGLASVKWAGAGNAKNGLFFFKLASVFEALAKVNNATVTVAEKTEGIDKFGFLLTFKIVFENFAG